MTLTSEREKESLAAVLSLDYPNFLSKQQKKKKPLLAAGTYLRHLSLSLSLRFSGVLRGDGGSMSIYLQVHEVNLEVN